MYYECIKKHESSLKNPFVKIVNVKNMTHLLQLRKKYDEVNLIEPKIVNINPRSMSKRYGRNQSFQLFDYNGNDYYFFNFVEFSKLWKVFTNPKVIVYERHQGCEKRKTILATIDENGNEYWF